MIQVKTLLYLAVCVAEVYVLKYMVLNVAQVNKISDYERKTKGSPITFICPPKFELQDRITLWGQPLEMEGKVAKLTYQKSRIFIILFFAIIL